MSKSIKKVTIRSTKTIRLEKINAGIENLENLMLLKLEEYQIFKINRELFALEAERREIQPLVDAMQREAQDKEDAFQEWLSA